MTGQDGVESGKVQTLRFLYKIGEVYAETSPELSRFYFSKYQRLAKAADVAKDAGKLCQYCGSKFIEGVNARTRILRKSRGKKDRKSTERLRKKCVIATKCGCCKRITFSTGCEQFVTPTHLKAMKKQQNEEQQKVKKSDNAITLPENYSSLSASAKRKWRKAIQIQKLKEKGVFFWKNAQPQPQDSKTNLMAFLSTIEK